MTFSCLAMQASVISGVCGLKASYTLNTETGLLKIEGTGPMEDYQDWEWDGKGPAPWSTSKDYITKVEIADGITSIGDYAFYDCTGITSVTIGNSVTRIGEEAFNYCSGLTSLTLGNSVTSIGYKAFYECSGLTSLIIPNSVREIDKEAFRYCSGLTTLTIPNSVTSVGSRAFDGCRFMSVVSKVENPTQDFHEKSFSDATCSHTPLYIPAGSFWKYIYDSGWYSFNIIKEYTVSPAEVSESKAYMIADANGFNYTVFEDGELKNVEFSHSLDESDMGTCWQVRKSGSRSYLYSPAAESYATMQDGKLQLTAAPVDVDLCEQDGTLCINGTKCMLVLNTEVQTPDAIGTISATSSDDDAIYDLQGRKMQNARNGIFIQNGKKIAIK